jgi:hypothetical protein
MLLRLHPADLDGGAPSPTWDVLKTTINVPCISGSVAGEPRIVPGDPADSVVYQLMDERGALQMPPIASLIVDVPDVTVVRAWIQALGAPADGGAPADSGGGEGGGGFGGDGGHHHDGGDVDAQADGGVAPDAAPDGGEGD